MDLENSALHCITMSVHVDSGIAEHSMCNTAELAIVSYLGCKWFAVP